MTFLLLAFEMKVELNCSEHTFNHVMQFNSSFISDARSRNVIESVASFHTHVASTSENCLAC